MLLTFFARAFALVTGWPQGPLSLWEISGATSDDDRGSSLDPNG